MKKFAVFLLLFFCLPVNAQVTIGPEEPTLSPEQQKSDFRIMVDAIGKHHPSAYRFVSHDSMQRSASSVLTELNEPMSEREFQLVVRRFITQVHCGHTVAMPSVDWYKRQRGNVNLFPFNPLVAGNGLYLPAALSFNGLVAGSEIVSINGRSASDILNQMHAIHTCDGFSATFTDYSINQIFQTYYLFLYGSEPEYVITYRNGNQTDTVIINSEFDIAIPAVPVKREIDAHRIAVSSDWSSLYIDEADSMAILRIAGFGNSHFKKYYRKVFRELKKRKIANLVIDVRNNGGGYFPNGNHLLRYLSKDDFTFRFSRPKVELKKDPNLHMGFGSRMTKSLFKLFRDPVDDENIRTYEIPYKVKKKKRFNGQLYVLMNGGSFSMSGYVSAFLKHRTNAVMIGEETGGGEEGSNAVLFQVLTLPASGVRVYIPYYHLSHQLQGTASERGVMPDIAVNYSVEDLLKGTDKELKTVLLEIRK